VLIFERPIKDRRGERKKTSARINGVSEGSCERTTASPAQFVVILIDRITPNENGGGKKREKEKRGKRGKQHLRHGCKTWAA